MENGEMAKPSMNRSMSSNQQPSFSILHSPFSISRSPTTVQQLGSIIKSARDIMRKDKGLNGDLDRLPMLTWILFLKFLDDIEQIREQEAALAGKKFRPAVEPPYRWRDWAAKEAGISGDERSRS